MKFEFELLIKTKELWTNSRTLSFKVLKPTEYLAKSEPNCDHVCLK